MVQVQEKPIRHTDFLNFPGGVCRCYWTQKTIKDTHRQKYQHTFLKWQWKAEKKRKKFPGTERLEGTKKTTNQLVKAAKIPSYLLNGTNALNKP